MKKKWETLKYPTSPRKERAMKMTVRKSSNKKKLKNKMEKSNMMTKWRNREKKSKSRDSKRKRSSMRIS